MDVKLQMCVHVHVCGTCIYVVHVIVVSWFLQCMGYVPREGCMYFRGRRRQLSCTIDRVRLPLGASTYCALAAQRKVPYDRRCSYSSIA